jgi:hypothetical protein
MVDKVRQQAIDAKAGRIDDRLIQDLRHGDIHKVLAKADIPKAAVHQFFSEQWQRWQSQIVQNYETFASEATVEPPNIDLFYDADPGNSFKGDDGQILLEGLFGGAKASSLKASTTTTDTEGEVLSVEDLDQMAQDAMDEWDSFSSEMWSSILNAQMVQEYESRMGEIMKEVQRIIALAKSGKIGPEWVLIALAKVNATKNGVIFSWLSKNAMAVNEEMNSITEELNEMDTSSSEYYATLQNVQSETRSKSFDLNMITNNMQKVMQNVSSTMDSVHSMIRSIFQARREIVAKIAAR